MRTQADVRGPTTGASYLVVRADWKNYGNGDGDPEKRGPPVSSPLCDHPGMCPATCPATCPPTQHASRTATASLNLHGSGERDSFRRLHWVFLIRFALIIAQKVSSGALLTTARDCARRNYPLKRAVCGR